ncbi:MAG: SDR family oxidoreductase [Pseudomonadota bacterium]
MSTTTSRPAALVTGGAIRLGKAIAKGLAASGYDIVLHYGRSEADAKRAQTELQSMGIGCVLAPFDLSTATDFAGYIDQAFAMAPNLTVLVNSASGYTQATLADTTLTDFDALFAVNLRAPFFLSQAFAARLQRAGSIINVLDNKIGFNQPNYAAYLLSKQALAQLTELAALEFAPAIRVNAVAPGVVMPAGSRSDDYVRWRLSAIPLGVQGQADQIVSAIQFLLTNAFVTGQIITVDGGENIAQTGRNAGDFDPSKI